MENRFLQIVEEEIDKNVFSNSLIFKHLVRRKCYVDVI